MHGGHRSTRDNGTIYRHQLRPYPRVTEVFPPGGAKLPIRPNTGEEQYEGPRTESADLTEHIVDLKGSLYGPGR
jgi:hypothetical protein